MLESDGIDTSNFIEILKNTDKVRKIVFGRKDLKSESIFEKFWSLKFDDKDSSDDDYKDAQFLECAHHIWNELRLWEKPEFLVMVNLFL